VHDQRDGGEQQNQNQVAVERGFVIVSHRGSIVSLAARPAQLFAVPEDP
jgi:hypothetical protein